MSFHILHQPQSVFIWHIFVAFVCLYTFIHHHRPQGPTLFRRVRWDLCSVMCAKTRDLLFSVPINKTGLCLVNPLLKGIKWESNLCLKASTGSQVKLTSLRLRLPWLTKKTSIFKYLIIPFLGAIKTPHLVKLQYMSTILCLMPQSYDILLWQRFFSYFSFLYNQNYKGLRDRKLGY